MATQKQGVRYTIAGLLAFVALISGIFVAQHMTRTPTIDPSKFHGTWLQSPRSIEAFALDSTEGKTFSNEDLKGQWTLMFFGFTSCGYLCPTTMAELGKTYRLLESKGVKPLPKVVMVSIDAERDNLDKMSSYVHAFDRHFHGARGEAPVVEKMAREMGIVYTRVAAPVTKEAMNYDIQHSGAIIVFNPKGELNAFFTTPHKAENLAADYRMIIG